MVYDRVKVFKKSSWTAQSETQTILVEETKKKSVSFSPQAKYIDRATAAACEINAKS
jgi:hypothetical protein